MLLTNQSLASLPMQTQASTSTMPPDSFQPHRGQPQAPSHALARVGLEKRVTQGQGRELGSGQRSPCRKEGSYLPKLLPPLSRPTAVSVYRKVISGSSPAQVHIQEWVGVGGNRYVFIRAREEPAHSCCIFFQDTGRVVTPWGGCHSPCCQGNTNSLKVSLPVTGVLSPQVRPEEEEEEEKQCAADPLKAHPEFLSLQD